MREWGEIGSGKSLKEIETKLRFKYEDDTFKRNLSKVSIFFFFFFPFQELISNMAQGESCRKTVYTDNVEDC